VKPSAPELPLIAPAQLRRSRREDPQLHRAIIAARQAGHRIYRAGLDHTLIDGRRIPDSELPKWLRLDALARIRGVLNRDSR
jgi:hypothetical protein